MSHGCSPDANDGKSVRRASPRCPLWDGCRLWASPVSSSSTCLAEHLIAIEHKFVRRVQKVDQSTQQNGPVYHFQAMIAEKFPGFRFRLQKSHQSQFCCFCMFLYHIDVFRFAGHVPLPFCKGLQ